MPSKKKARGKIKARRVAKSRKAREEDAAANVTAQMQRLQIGNNNNQDEDENALLEVAINLAAAEKDELEAAAKNDEANNTEECLHGFVTLPSGRMCGVHCLLIHLHKHFLLAVNPKDPSWMVLTTLMKQRIEVWNDPDK